MGYAGDGVGGVSAVAKYSVVREGSGMGDAAWVAVYVSGSDCYG